MATVDLKELNKRIEQRLIKVQKHPDAELYIYNYTPIAQFGRQWDEYTLMCRDYSVREG
jgi:RNA ligase